MIQSAAGGVMFGIWKDLRPRPADCDLARRLARDRGPHLPARATSAETIAGAAQEADEPVGRDRMDCPGPAHHRARGGDEVSLKTAAA